MMLLALVSSVASAQDITWEFTAEAYAVDSAFNGEIVNGTVMTGSFTFSDVTGSGGIYTDAISAMEFTTVGQTWTSDTLGNIQVGNGGTDTYSIGISIDGPAFNGAGSGDVLTPASMPWALFDSDGTVFSDTSLPLDPPDPSLFETTQVVMRFDSSLGGQATATFALTDWVRNDVDTCPDTPKTSPGLCGCDYEDLDSPLDGDAVADSCVHYAATLDAGASFGPGLQIEAFAQVADATLGDNVTVASRATVGSGSIIGTGGVISRRATVEPGVTLGADAVVGRAARIRTGVDAGSDLSIAFGSVLGADTQLGDGVTIGALATIEAASIGNDVVMARGVQVGAGSTIGLDTVLGPNVMLGANNIVGERVRMRKDVEFGAGASIGDDATIGRGTQADADVTVGADAKVRSAVIIGEGATVDPGALIPRATVIPADVGLRIGVFAHSRDGWGLAETASTFPFKTWLQGTAAPAMDAELVPVATVDATSLAGLDAFVLIADRQGCSYSGGLCVDPGVTSTERAALYDFVEAGGGLAVFRGYNVGNVIDNVFGTIRYTTAASSGVVQLQAGVPSALGSGAAFGPMPSSLSWGSNIHYRLDGTASGAVIVYNNVNDFREMVALPPGAVAPGSGPVVFIGDFYNNYTAGGVWGDVGGNAVAYVAGYAP